MTPRVNVMLHPMGWGWASHHPCAKWKGIFFIYKANASWHQVQNQGFSVLLEWKKMAQQWAKCWAKGGSAAAGAIAVQANSTSQVSGETVILNFLKKLMPTVACKNLAVKSFP